VPILTDYHFGTLRIDGAEVRKDLIVLGDRVITPWWRKRGHRLQGVDIEEVLAAHPRVLIVGTGYFGRMKIDASAEAACRAHGIELIAERTGPAVKRFSALGKDDGAALAIHLTC